MHLRPLNLALVTRHYPPLIGGEERVLSYLAKALAIEVSDVTVITSQIPGCEPVTSPQTSVMKKGNYAINTSLVKCARLLRRSVLPGLRVSTRLLHPLTASLRSMANTNRGIRTPTSGDNPNTASRQPLYQPQEHSQPRGPR